MPDTAVIHHEILDAIDRELATLEKRLSRLRDARALVSEAQPAAVADPVLAPAKPSRAASQSQPKSKRAPRALPWTVDEALEPIRDTLADGAATVHQIFTAVGKSRNTHTANVVRRVLEQLRATQDADGKWSLPKDPPPTTQQPPRPAEPPAHSNGSTNGTAPADDVDQAYLERALLRELRAEPATIEGVSEAVDAPLDQVTRAVQRLVGMGQLSRMDNGLICG